MASKLVPLIATVLVLLHAAAATSRTSVDIYGGSAGSGGGYRSQECRLQVESRDLSPCVQFLSEEEDRRYYPGGEVGLSGRGSRAFYECCNELESVEDYSCRCEGLHVAIQAARGSSESRSLTGVAERLPQMCGIEPETCQFSSDVWY